MVLNGTIGARLHISFSVLNRSSFGFWFSYFSVISRAVLAMFWFGIQVLLCTVFPKTKLNFIKDVYRFGMHLPNVKGYLAFCCSYREPLARSLTYYQCRSVNNPHPNLFELTNVQA